MTSEVEINRREGEKKGVKMQYESDSEERREWTMKPERRFITASLEVPFPMGVGIQTRWIVEGALQLSKVMAHLQLATVAIMTAEAVGMEGDLDDLMSSEEDSMGQGEEGPSQDQ